MVTKPPQRVLITLATYNEIDNLPSLVDAILQQAPQADVLVIDDNSPDGTGKWCDERAGSDARVRCLHRPGKLGLGGATVAAMKQAMEDGYEWMVNMDADFSHHPRHLPDILEAAQDATVDVVIGSRYVRGGRVEGWPIRRKLMSRGVNAYARLLLGLKAKDCSGAFRAYRVAALRTLDLDATVSQGYSFQEEILWRLKLAGAKMVERPIVFADRQYGKSKINSREALDALLIILRLGVRNWTRRSPEKRV